MKTIPRQGDRLRLVTMHDDPDPILVGQLGTVVGVTRHGSDQDEWFQIDVSWDNGRTLMLVSPPDVFEIVDGGSAGVFSWADRFASKADLTNGNP